jgi:glycosyltransferase involved in cell wall biosynthesis
MIESIAVSRACPAEGGDVPDYASKVSLTIAIPAYNRRESVLGLVDSIRGQMIEGDELIVSDDSSSDGTAERVSAIPGVRVVGHETNQGMVANWNACLRAANCEWVCIIHDDDELMPGGLDALRSACAMANGPALIVHNYAGDHFGGALRCVYSEPSWWSVLNCPTIPSGAVVHRAIIESVGLFDTRFKYSTDLEYFARIAARFPVVVIESPRVVNYKLHGANYQFSTWEKADFYEQFEELQCAIIRHAEIDDENVREELLAGRLVGNLLYMLRVADQMGKHELVKTIAGHCKRFSSRLSKRQKLQLYLAGATGRWLHSGRRWGSS